MWIWQEKNFPNFTWNETEIFKTIAEIRYQQGLLFGRIKDVGFEEKGTAIIEAQTQNVINSALIENEHLSLSDVRSSIARHLGFEKDYQKADRKTEGMVEMLLDATGQSDKPLTKQRLCGWHNALFPDGFSGIHAITVAKWREEYGDPMQVVSGMGDRMRVYFEAPPARLVESMMQRFLEWVENEEIDPIIKSGISHFWFLTIHPFEDGNGRIARAISDAFISQSDGVKHRFYNLSSQIQKDKKNYYKILQMQQRSDLDISPWLNWYLITVKLSLESANHDLDKILFKSQLWQKINNHQSTNGRQKNIINLMLSADFKGNINTSKYAKLCKCSTDTALRDINQLKKRGIFIKNPENKGRNTSYFLSKSIGTIDTDK